ncbi:MAG: SDR family oxidoreductase [Bacteroidia bacterium]|nr:SDR family oxidoreductase [Bacteroidia bacterium]
MKNILIIGASSGIGRQTALQASEAGYKVYGTYFKNGNEIPPNIHSCFLDAQNPVFEDGFLPEVLDGFMYCPGSIQLKPFHRISAESFTADFELNVASGIRVLQWVLPLLKKSEAASVLFFSTVAVQSGFSFHAQVSASKGALEGLTRALAVELAPKIRVNCIAPSITQTPLAAQLLSTPEKIENNAQRHVLKRVGVAGDIANMAVFLLSDSSSWVTGQIMHVDGGMGMAK